MTHRSLRKSFGPVLFALLSLVAVQPASAQFKDLIGIEEPDDFSSSAPSEPEVTAELKSDSDGVAVLSIKVILPPNAHTYSTNPPFSGRSKIQIKASSGLKPIDDKITADRKPEIHDVEFLGRVEEYYENVTWSKKFQIEPGAKAATIEGILAYQVCDENNCRPLKAPFKATLALNDNPSIPPPSDSGSIEKFPLKQQGQHRSKIKGVMPITFEFELAPANATAGDEVEFRVTAKLDPTYHTFALNHNPKNIGKPTKFVIESESGLEPVDAAFQSATEPETHLTDDGKPQLIHHKSVVWTRRYRVRSDSSSGQFGLKGKVVYQVCTANFCVPGTIKFALGTIGAAKPNLPIVGTPNNTESNEHKAGSRSGGGTLSQSAVLNGFTELDDGSVGTTTGGLGTYILFAFLGGLILNIMPCVLPVIAIKALSFVQQAEESRERLLALNLSYSVGVLSVFLTLASLAAFASLGWGGLFQSVEFNISMACIVFIMALSLLGVFELPVPGMIGSAAGDQHQEGLFGAFMTGIFATLLATPCSGPFLGTTLGWSVQQSPGVIYLVWSVMGLGMASPYILFGFFPGAIKWLPRPGNWMVRFKEFCGIVLLGTVLFIVSFMDETYTIPVLVLLLGIGLGTWMIGKLYDLNSPFRKKFAVRVFALISVVGIGYFGLGLRNPGVQLPWEDFANARIDDAVNKEGKTVLIDFTAEWCLSCKTVEKIALNTKPTLDLVKQHDVVVIRADWTDGSPEVTKWLDGLKSVSIPVTAIIPANRPEQPIVLRDLYTQETLLKSLRRAVELPPDSQNQSAKIVKRTQQSL